MLDAFLECLPCRTVAGYDAVQYSELDPVNPSRDVRVGVVLFMKPLTDFLSFSEESTAGNSSRCGRNWVRYGTWW